MIQLVRAHRRPMSPPKKSLVLVAAVFIVLIGVTTALTVSGRSTLAWFGSGSCPMPGGFVPGQKCLAVDANGVEVPYKGEIILPHGATTITDHVLTNGSHAVTGNYELQIVEDNGSCCTTYQTFDYTVDSSGKTSPASFVLNQATLSEAFTHHAVGTGGLLGYFLYISQPSAMGAADTCQNIATFLDGDGAPLSATSQTGEKCNPPQPVPGSGQLVSHIFDCAAPNLTTDVTPAGMVAVTAGPVTRAGAPSPIGYSALPVGSYMLTATAPTGFHLMGDGCTPGSKSQGSAAVPLQGTGEVDFYVARDSGTVVGHVYDCTSGTADTTRDIAGGQIAVSGPVNEVAAPNPILYNVVAGTYTETATAPITYHLTSATCEATSGSTAQVVVPANGQGEGKFYVARDSGAIAGDIYDCSAGTKSTTEVSGGTLSAGGAGTVTAMANPMPATAVPTGSYTVTGSAPSGYHFVVCQDSPGGASVGVTVVAGQTASAVLYVARNDPGAGNGTGTGTGTGTGGGTGTGAGSGAGTGTGNGAGTGSGTGAGGGTEAGGGSGASGGQPSAAGVLGAAAVAMPFTGRDDLARVALLSLVLIAIGVASLFISSGLDQPGEQPMQGEVE